MSTNLPPTKPPAEVHPMQALLDQEGSVMPQRGDICKGEIELIGIHVLGFINH